MKKARTLLAIWLALILTLTLFPTALATGDGSEPTGGATNNSFTVNVHALEGIANPTQNVENGTWTQGDLVFTFTLTEGYANPSVALTIGDASITDLPLSGPDSDGKYTLTVPENKITGNVNLSLSAAKEESGEPTPPQGDGNNDANPSGGGTTLPSNSNYKVTFWSGSGTPGNYYDLPNNVDNMPADVNNVPAGKYTIPDNIPTIAYNVFLYWTDDSGKKVNPGEEIDISSDVNLSAWWQKTADISFNTDSGVGTFNPTKVPLTEGATYTLPKDTPTKAGYVFKGWKDTNGTIYQANAPYPLNTSGSGYAVAFTAQWSKGLTVNYDIGTSYNPGGGPKSGEVVDVTKPYTIPKDEPRRSSGSYEFGSWTLNINGKTYQPGATINWDKVGVTDATASVTFTANWSHMTYPDKGNDDKPSKPSKPTYDEYRIRATCSDGGWVSPAGSTYVREGRNLTVTFAPYKGYAIDGVYIDGVLDNRYDGSYTFRDVDENHTIYVRYVRDSGSSGGGSHWDDDTSPKTGDASAPLSMGLGVGSLALIAFLVARKMRRA